jgi:pheromone shutdown protein TraB
MDFIREIFSDMNPTMMHDLEKFHPQSYKIFLDHKNKYLYQMIRANLERGLQEELYRDDINIDIIAKFRLEGMMIAFNQEVFPASRYNLAETHQAIIEHFLFGVATMKGYKLILKYQQERTKS